MPRTSEPPLTRRVRRIEASRRTASTPATSRTTSASAATAPPISVPSVESSDRVSRSAATPTTPSRATTARSPKTKEAARLSLCRSRPCWAAAAATDGGGGDTGRDGPHRGLEPARAGEQGDEATDDRAADERDQQGGHEPGAQQLGPGDRRVEQPEALGGGREHRPEQPGDGQRGRDRGEHRGPRQQGARGEAGRGVAAGDDALRLEDDVHGHRADHQRGDDGHVRVAERLAQVAGGAAAAPVLHQPAQLAGRGGRQDGRRGRLGPVDLVDVGGAHPRGAPSVTVRVATLSTRVGSWLAKTMARPC